jgi:hypothetical protein
MDSEQPVDRNLVRARPCPSPENNRDGIDVLQSPSGTTQNLSRLDFMLVGL